MTMTTKFEIIHKFGAENYSNHQLEAMALYNYPTFEMLVSYCVSMANSLYNEELDEVINENL